jgi:tRNA (guanine-N7-)-methyltransferase
MWRFCGPTFTGFSIFSVPDEVNEIWITFPDPQPRVSQLKNRSTDPRYLTMYREILVNAGVLHLKTDHDDFFDFSIESLRQNGFDDLVTTRDLYSSEMNNLHLWNQDEIRRNIHKEGIFDKIPKMQKGGLIPRLFCY